MSNSRGLDRLEIAVHVIFILVGIIILGCVPYTETQDSFLRPLLINVGSSLIVVTLIFSIFELFRRENSYESDREKYREEQRKMSGARADLVRNQETPKSKSDD